MLSNWNSQEDFQMPLNYFCGKCQNLTVFIFLKNWHFENSCKKGQSCSPVVWLPLRELQWKHIKKTLTKSEVSVSSAEQNILISDAFTVSRSAFRSVSGSKKWPWELANKGTSLSPGNIRVDSEFLHSCVLWVTLCLYNPKTIHCQNCLAS